MQRILLIEEDRDMRALTEEWLRQAGYQVDALPGDPLAPGGRFDVIVCGTVNLRGPGAVRLERLASAHPDMPLIALSGQQRHSLARSSDKAGVLGVSAVLAKPFTQAELLAAVAAALSGGR